ncbi:MAG: prolyl oligopeptidase family serine peptidase [Chitinophagaceae bacterium]|nr:prolyl oligopeptidase family serine peptidase [Chitinophagaceae bacterium]
MKYYLLIALCIGYGSLTAQVNDDSVKVGAHFRTFHFIEPKEMKKGAAVVFVVHGSGGDGYGMMERSKKLQEKIKGENVFLVFPDGYKRFWNECRKASPAPANIENIDDVGFFSEMINYFVKKFSANRQQIFVVGTSGGGHMVYKLAMESPENFKAFTAIVANVPDTDNLDCAPKNIAVSIMIINGTKDAINPYNGGPVILSDKVNMGNVLSTDRTFSYWAKLAGYNGNPTEAKLPDTDPSDGKTIEKYVYSEKGKPEVILLKVINGVHGYPNDIDVHLEAWEFFKRHM